MVGGDIDFGWWWVCNSGGLWWWWGSNLMGVGGGNDYGWFCIYLFLGIKPILVPTFSRYSHFGP